MDDTGSGQDIQERLGRTLDVATTVLTDPKGFFEQLARDEPLERPLLFATVMLVASGILHAVLSLVGLLPGGFFGSLISVPIAGGIGLLVLAAILFFAAKALGGEATFESSVRIVGYVSAILPVQTVLGIIPYLPLLAGAYAIYITIVAVIAVERVPEERAWTVLGGIGALMLGLALVSTMTARRAAHRLETWGTHLEKSAEELQKAAEKLQRDMGEADE